MARVFINYRRDETAGEARALFTELRAALGADSVFMDVDNIALGRDFRQALNERLESVDLMVTLIGKDWLQIKDASGRRRLDDANDFVRREIRAALERDIAVIPLLLQGAHMPAEADLPEDIRSLAFRNGFEISHARWNSDVHELLGRLGLTRRGSVNPPPAAEAGQMPVAAATNQAPAEPTPRANSKRGARTGWLVLALLGLVAGGGFAYYRHVEGERVRQVLAQADAEKQRLLQEAEQAKAAAAAAGEAAARAQHERERAEAEAREHAGQAERDREAAEQLARKRAAEKAVQDQAAKDKAAREQAAKEQAAKELAAKEQAAKAQAAREQAARDQAAKDQAAKTQAEREAAARAAKERRIAVIAKGQFTGSIAGALGDYAEWRRMPLTDLNDRTAASACGKWSEQVPPDEARNFRASCLLAARDHATFDLRLGARPSATQWTSFCESRAQRVPTDVSRSSFIATCTKYR